MKKYILLAVLLLASISTVTAVNIYKNINACGAYTSGGGGPTVVYNLTNDITVTSATAGTVCVDISILDTYAETFVTNEHSITYSNGTATTAIRITHATDVVDRAGVAITFTGNLILNNFFKGLEYTTANTAGSYEINPTIYCTNCTYAFYADLTAQAKLTTVVYPCNTSHADWINISGSGLTHSFTINTNATCKIKPTIQFATTQPNDGIPFLNSNKLFNGNVNFTSFQYNSLSGGISYLGNIKNTQFSESLTYPAWYFNNPLVYFVSGTDVNLYPASNLTMISSQLKDYYCVGGLCNPLYLVNYTYPFYINVPDYLQTVYLATNYTTLKIFWKQGLTDYLVAASINNQDQYFSLQSNGVFNFEIDGVNTTVTNSCPSIYSICTLILGSNSTYNITPYTNLNDMWSDIFYTFTPPVSNNWITNDTNFTFTISSVRSDLVYYGLVVVKTFNLTSTVVYNVSTNLTSSGGSLTYQTNGTGRYDFYPYFKITGMQQYNLPPSSIWQGAASGLAALAAQLQAGALLSGWAYAFIALLISALAVIYFSQYSFTGAGIVGCAIFDFFALLWPSASIIGVLDFGMVAFITTALTLFWAARSL